MDVPPGFDPVLAQETGNSSLVFPVLGVIVCVSVRLAGLKYQVNVPVAPSVRYEDRADD